MKPRPVVAAVIGMLFSASAAMAEANTASFPPDVVAQLESAKEIYVATMRKDGTRSKVVPVWFSMMDGAVWFTTAPNSHKVRRIKKGSPLLVSTHGADGPFMEMHAEIINDGALADRLGEIYAKKYWLVRWTGLFRPSRARNESGKTVLLKLTPQP